MQPLLEFLKDDREKNYSEVIDYLKDYFKLSQEDLEIEKPLGGNYFYNKIGWAKNYLVRANLLEAKRGKFKITPRGRDIVNQQKTVNVQFLSQFDEFANRQISSDGKPQLSDSEKSPEDLIDEGTSQINDMLYKDLSQKLETIDPTFFEELIVELIEKLHYGKGKRIGRSGDKGIDGEISQDALGLDKIYLQAKRYTSNVPAHDVRDFLGALSLKNARKGIFITTSDFPSEAYDDVKKSDKNIILINGEQLIKHMIDCNVGVKDKDIIKIKEIDANYFE